MRELSMCHAVPYLAARVYWMPAFAGMTADAGTNIRRPDTPRGLTTPSE